VGKLKELRYKVVPGYRFYLLNPYELIIKGPGKDIIVIKDDDIDQPPMLPIIMESIKKASFTINEILTLVDESKRDSAKKIVSTLIENHVLLIEDEKTYTLELKTKADVLLITYGAENLANKLVSTYEKILNLNVSVSLNTKNYISQINEIRNDITKSPISLIIYCGVIDTEILEEVNRIILSFGIPLLSVLFLSHKSSIVGPLIIPYKTSCMKEFVLWLLNSEVIPDSSLLAYTKPTDYVETREIMLYKPLELITIGLFGEVLIDTVKTLYHTNYKNYTYAGKAIFVDLDRKIISVEGILKIPGCTACTRKGKKLYSDSIVTENLLYFLMEKYKNE